MEPQPLQPSAKMSKIELHDTFPASSLKNQKWMSPSKIVYKQGFHWCWEHGRAALPHWEELFKIW